MQKDSMRAYADLLVTACLGIGEGSRLRIACELPHRAMARAVAEAAWKRGAREVRVDCNDSLLSRLAVENLGEAWIDQPSGFALAEAERYATELWSYLGFTGPEDPAVWEGVDPGRLQRLNKARSISASPFRKAAMSNAIAWCIAPHPTADWASAVYALSGRPLPPDPEAALWADLLPILRLDAADPAAAWLADNRRLEARARAMDGAGIAALRFRGPGTDLEVGLSPRSRWVGGGSRTKGGAYFTANIPSEEVFTTPDFRLTRGRAAATKPVKVLGATVTGAWFRFDRGRVVDSGAERNADILGRYLDIDPGARLLGEIAIVEDGNPVGRSGLVFDNGLLDENAACHLALGSGYDEAFEGSGGMDEAARLEAGFNDSLVHTDFMIGSTAVEVTAMDRAGQERPLVSGGKFVL